ncbi:MAG: DNA repair protein RecN [Candidatus Bruticola sp.]
MDSKNMLSELAIHNFALVENETFFFTDGLNILTGETGAGKSLIIDAMGFLLGSMMRDKPLRSGAQSGFVAARFVDLPPEVKTKLEELGFEESEEGELLMSRDFKAAGRTSCRINSKPATVAALRELGSMLVDLHGQHQQYSLLRPNDHGKVLDRYIISRYPLHEQLLNKCAELYRQCRDLHHELQELREGERSRLREIDWAEHELNEIEEADPKIGEDKNLEEQIKILSSAADLRNGALSAHAELIAENGLRDRLALVCGELNNLTSQDKRLCTIVNSFNEALAIIDDNIYELSAYADSITSDNECLDKLQQRYDKLRTIMRKYGPNLEDVLNYRQTTAEHLEQLNNSSSRSEQLEKTLLQTLQQRDDIAQQLSDNRHKFASELSQAVETELSRVDMPHCRFSVSFANNKNDGNHTDNLTGLIPKFNEYGNTGADIVEFVIAPNPGEAPKPLAQIASGGEISRIMLALLSLFSEFQKTATFFFDEIDTGLGGLAAQAVAERLRVLASRSQVICITHLPILAVVGKRHHYLYKEIQNGRTSTHVRILEGNEREQEIARMMSGGASLNKALEHAQSLLAAAQTASNRPIP